MNGACWISHFYGNLAGVMMTDMAANIEAGLFSADSGVGSNVHPSTYGSGNLNDVEEADIEAGQILTALKSSPSPIRSVLSAYRVFIVNPGGQGQIYFHSEFLVIKKRTKSFSIVCP